MIDDREKSLLARPRDHIAVGTDATRPRAILLLPMDRVRQNLCAIERWRFPNEPRQTARLADRHVELGDDEPDLRAIGDVHRRQRVRRLDDRVSLAFESLTQVGSGVGLLLDEQDRARIHRNLDFENLKRTGLSVRIRGWGRRVPYDEPNK